MSRAVKASRSPQKRDPVMVWMGVFGGLLIVWILVYSCVSITVTHQLVDQTPPLYDPIVNGASLDEIKTAIKRDPSVVGATRNGGESNLHCAVSEKRVDVARLLLEAGEDPNFFRNQSPLMVAVSQEDIEMMRLLLKHDADPDKPSAPAGITPREIGVDSKNEKIAEIFRRARKTTKSIR